MLYFIYKMEYKGEELRLNRVFKIRNEIRLLLYDEFKLYILDDKKHIFLIDSFKEELDSSDFSVVVYDEDMHKLKWNILDLWRNWDYIFIDAYNLHNTWSYIDIYILTHARNIEMSNLNRLNLNGAYTIGCTEGEDGYYKIWKEHETIPFKLKYNLSSDKFFAGLARAMLRT